jgi:hypothetical protein
MTILQASEIVARLAPEGLKLLPRETFRAGAAFCTPAVDSAKAEVPLPAAIALRKTTKRAA